MAIGIDPTVDYAFKRLLGSPEFPEITVHFLNAVLASGPRIEEVTILNPMMEKEFDTDKLSILDVLAHDEHGRAINIEIQTTLPAGLRERLTYYTASLFVGQLHEGEGYSVLNPAIGICVLGKTLIRQSPRIHHDFRLRSEDAGVVLTDRFQIHLLELPKYSVPSDNSVIRDPLDQWCFLFRRAADLTPAEVLSRLPGPEFEKAVGVLEMIARTPGERSQYELRLKLQRDEAARIEAAREQGLEQGRIEGEAVGEARGEARGRVRVLEGLLGIASPANFDALTLEDLATRERDLQRQLRDRRIV